MTTPESNIDDEELNETTSEEIKRIPPTAAKVSRFGPPAGSKFGKWATSFSPPNKQRPGRAAGRGR